MPTSAERFYRKMASVRSLEGLIGQPEDADFDCKEWPRGADATRGTIAKAACGFANATGGVILIGLKASGRGVDTPDLVQSLAPVVDRKAVSSAALDIILKLVEPGIEGVKVKTISDQRSKTSGFVLILVPASESSPKRSKVDWRFYVRIASGTVPMEFFQVEERFGRRPLPRLSLHIEPLQIMSGWGWDARPLRQLLFGLRNEGRGIAKFPGIRFKQLPNLKHDNMGINGNGGLGLPLRASESDWIVFRGGVDDVIYPGETRLIGKLIQLAIPEPDRVVTPSQFEGHQFVERLCVCEAINLDYEISAEGIASQRLTCRIDRDSVALPTR